MGINAAFILPHPPLIVPDVGKGEEEKIRKTVDAYRQAAREIAEIKPETIILTSPHATAYADYLHVSPGKFGQGSFKQFGAPDCRIEAEYDSDFVKELGSTAEELGIPAGTRGERSPELDHGTMVPLYFVNQYYKGYKLVRCSISGMSPAVHYDFGRCIFKTANRLNRRAVLIASGDLSHMLTSDGPYGYAPEGPEFDRQVTQAMAEGDFLRFLTFEGDFCDAAGECGLRSFQILAGVFDGLDVKTELLSYEGPFGVGYAVCTVYPDDANENRKLGEKYKEGKQAKLAEQKNKEDEYVRLARFSLETFIQEGKLAECPENLPKEITAKKAGVFVSLKKDGQLRGCIGTIEATQNSIADEIIHNAVSAGVRDPRFEPVGADELDDLVYSVDILGKAEPIGSMEELDPKRYGVIVSKGTRSGLLLPNLSGINTPKQQVEIALEKAGIGPDEPYEMERFEVVRHK
ncbi:MAG TPA: AmmeMemoRadiSam system protein A [Caproiciproducens sp.]|nr:AmmeMemoRadiSam system protein A [Caproiciproducens sp.]